METPFSHHESHQQQLDVNFCEKDEVVGGERRHVRVHKENELVRDKGITNILDSKQQRIASIY